MAKLPKTLETARACGLGAFDWQLTLTLALARERRRCKVWVLNEYRNYDSWSLLYVCDVIEWFYLES